MKTKQVSLKMALNQMSSVNVLCFEAFPTLAYIQGRNVKSVTIE
jgi:hypothetical protein